MEPLPIVSTPPAGGLAAIHAVIEQCGEDSDRFAETLRHRGIEHLSFSQISTVEFCPRRYYLEYVALRDISPTPLYFIKGKLFHQVIANLSRQAARGEAPDLDGQRALIDRELEGEDRRHLHNALQVYLDQRWADAEVLSVEQPFVMSIAPDLPPCVGVIDLVLRRDGALVLLDHKTGRDFFAEDPLQMAIYVEYMRRQYGDTPCVFYYDHYRWVPDLARIRKPAFQRNAVQSQATPWPAALSRIRAGYERIAAIRAGAPAERTGECFRCPYRGACWG